MPHAMAAFAAAAVILLHVQAAWADCSELNQLAEPNMAALASAGDHYRATGVSQVKYRLLGKADLPPNEVVIKAISETSKMIEAMEKYLDYMNSMKNGGCYGENVGAQSAGIVMLKAQRDELVMDQKRFTEFLAKRLKVDGQPQQ